MVSVVPVRRVREPVHLSRQRVWWARGWVEPPAWRLYVAVRQAAGDDDDGGETGADRDPALAGTAGDQRLGARASAADHRREADRTVVSGDVARLVRHRRVHGV